MKKLEEMKRNELIEEMKKRDLKFSNQKNHEMIEMIKKFDSMKENQENQEIKKEMNFKERILKDEKLKKSNYQEIHEKFKDSQEISFIESLELKYDEKSLKEIIEENKENIELLMIHRESRKIYYLFLFDFKNEKEYFIMKNDSIMKNKIFSLKLSQYFNLDEIQISYIKYDRKNQSKEIIKKDSREYIEKLKKYHMI